MLRYDQPEKYNEMKKQQEENDEKMLKQFEFYSQKQKQKMLEYRQGLRKAPMKNIKSYNDYIIYVREYMAERSKE